MNTYCYAHGLVHEGCVICEARVGEILSGNPPFRPGINPEHVWRQFFPDLSAPKMAV